MIKLHELKSITTLALPLVAAFFAQKGMQLIDTLMMGWIGPEALAAGALGTAVFITILVFCMGTLSAVGIFIARARSINDSNEIKACLYNGCVLALTLCIPCIIIIWLSPHLLLLLGQNALVVKDTSLLIHALVWGFPGYLLFLVFREFVSAFSFTKIVMLVTLGSIPLTFLLNYLFIYGKIGFPALGIAGIGYAGSIVMWFMFLCLLIYSRKNKDLRSSLSFNLNSINYSKIIDMLYIGTPSGIFFILESLMFVSATIMMGHFGVTALAAHQIAMQCATVAYSIPFALSMATALQVSHAIGSKNILQAERYTFISLGISLTISIAVAMIFIFMPELLVKPFLRGNITHLFETNKLAISFLAVAALFQCLDAVQAITNGALRGMKDTFIPMLLCIACYWIIGINSSYYLSFHTSLGAKGIWYGLTMGLCSTGLLLLFRFLRKINTEKRKMLPTLNDF